MDSDLWTLRDMVLITEDRVERLSKVSEVRLYSKQFSCWYQKSDIFTNAKQAVLHVFAMIAHKKKKQIPMITTTKWYLKIKNWFQHNETCPVQKRLFCGDERELQLPLKWRWRRYLTDCGSLFDGQLRFQAPKLIGICHISENNTLSKRCYIAE